MAGFSLSEEQCASFAEDGFVVVPSIIPPAAAARLRERFEPLFRGEFETGLMPDEWNWREGRDAPDLTRQICNGWKAPRATPGRSTTSGARTGGGSRRCPTHSTRRRIRCGH